MKKLIVFGFILISNAALAATGTVTTKPNIARPNSVDISIHGGAAKDISDNLSAARINFIRDHFSGQLVQSGNGVLCIKKNENTRPYCYLNVDNGSVN